MPYLYLSIAIFAEVVATTALKATENFTHPLPSVVVVVGYGVAFYFLARCLAVLPVGIAYAIWSGLGTALIVVVGILWFGEALTWARAVSILLILIGVIGLNLSGSPH